MTVSSTFWRRTSADNPTVWQALPRRRGRLPGCGHLFVRVLHARTQDLTLLLCRLLATHEEERARISALIAPDGSIGSQVAERLAAVQQRERELRALEDTRANLEQRMRAFSGMFTGGLRPDWSISCVRYAFA